MLHSSYGSSFREMGEADPQRRYAYALGPPMRSLTTLVVLTKFILTDELLPAFAVANLVGGEFSLHFRGGVGHKLNAL